MLRSLCIRILNISKDLRILHIRMATTNMRITGEVDHQGIEISKGAVDQILDTENARRMIRYQDAGEVVQSPGIMTNVNHAIIIKQKEVEKDLAIPDIQMMTRTNISIRRKVIVINTKDTEVIKRKRVENIDLGLDSGFSASL